MTEQQKWTDHTFNPWIGCTKVSDGCKFCYAEKSDIWKWRPSIFMPKWASRITLEITGVRVERVQDITHHDMKAEGCLPSNIAGGYWDVLRDQYWKPLWDSINAQRGYGYESNPHVWVVEFKRAQP